MIENSGDTNGLGLADGTINTASIYNTHQEIKKVVSEYINIQDEINNATRNLIDNWEGLGCGEFKNQYKFLISKIDDFGHVLADLYDKLVLAEFSFEEKDSILNKEMLMAMGGEKSGE